MRELTKKGTSSDLVLMCSLFLRRDSFVHWKEKEETRHRKSLQILCEHVFLSAQQIYKVTAIKQAIQNQMWLQQCEEKMVA